MPYKDKTKQKKANRAAKQRSRAKNAGMTQNRIIDEIKTHQNTVGQEKSVIPEPVIPANQGMTTVWSCPKCGATGTPVTGSQCHSFETLPPDLQYAIDQLSPTEGTGAGPEGIDRPTRITNAIHYAEVSSIPTIRDQTCIKMD